MWARAIKITLCALILAGAAYGEAGESRRILALDLGGPGEAAEPERLSIGSGSEIFILDRARALLIRVCPETGRALWEIDGTESGQPFVDPVYLSRPDGFFIYLTDRGSRRIWRVDYRGEVRGSIDLPFAADPVMLELVAGSQMAVFDRATAQVHLLDDSGRPLWSFAAGGGRKAAEPEDIAVSADGTRLYLLWPQGGGITAVDIFGRTAHEITCGVRDFIPRRIAAVAAADRTEWLCLTDRLRRVILLDSAGGAVREQTPGISPVLDIGSAVSRPGVIYLLAGVPPELMVIDLEKEE